MKKFLPFLGTALLALLFAGCDQPGTPTSTAPTNDTAALTAANNAIDGNELLQHIKTLSSDDFGGRAPGSDGEDKTVNYLTDQFKKLGLKPGNPDGSYVQKVPMVGIKPDPSAELTFEGGGKKKSLKYKDDFVAWTRHIDEHAAINNSDLVFVGYGVVAPEFSWDDYKDVDVKGKTLVMLINDPPVPDPSDPNKKDPKTFGGEAMTYYGRWTYKFEIGAKKGAAGVLIVHDKIPAGYDYNVVRDSNSGERFNLVTPDKNANRCAIEGWITMDQAKDLFSMAGKDFAAMQKQAISRDFKPIDLGVKASVSLTSTLHFVDSKNVVAKIEGSDPKLKDEYVIYTAHWDHLGTKAELPGDKVFNGAIDNASGTSGLLEIAKGFTKLPTPPKRSILFVSVTAEEQGLLGSQYYAENPLYPLAKTLANINMDELNVHGKTKDVTIVGLGNSELDDYTAAAAKEQGGRTLHSEEETGKGFYYRSDHFNFAKVGVPALDPNWGEDFVGKEQGWGKKMHDEWEEKDYHSPSDEVKPDWDMSGAVQDLQLFLTVGYRVAQADKYPQWKSGTEFKATREAQLKASGVNQ